MPYCSNRYGIHSAVSVTPIMVSRAVQLPSCIQWGQDLALHPHLHCIIPSGGITANNKWKSSPTKGDYLFNTEALAQTFQGKFLWYLKKYFKEGELQFWDLHEHTQQQYFYQLKETLYAKNWVVYSKKSFRNEQSVFEYLGRHTHKIAISNARIKSVTNKEVSFKYTDRADDSKRRYVPLKVRVS